MNIISRFLEKSFIAYLALSKIQQYRRSLAIILLTLVVMIWVHILSCFIYTLINIYVHAYVKHTHVFYMYVCLFIYNIAHCLCIGEIK